MASTQNREVFMASLDKNRVHMETGEKIPKSHVFLGASTTAKNKSGAYTGLKGGGKKSPAAEVHGKSSKLKSLAGKVSKKVIAAATNNKKKAKAAVAKKKKKA